MPTKPVTLTSEQEELIKTASSELGRLDVVEDILPRGTYLAMRRKVLRDLVKRVTLKERLEAAK